MIIIIDIGTGHNIPYMVSILICYSLCYTACSIFNTDDDSISNGTIDLF